MNHNALILFAHGARDPRWAEPFIRLRDKVAAVASGTRVAVAYLEMMAPDLPTTVAEMVAAGCRSVVIVPVFFGQGGHVRNDLPRLVADLSRQYPALSLRCTAAIGEDDAVLDALAAFCLAAIGKS